MPIGNRFSIEVGLAAASTFMFLASLVWPDWIEIVFGVDPDHGDGSVERLVVVALLAIALTCSALARIDWRRLRAADPERS